MLSAPASDSDSVELLDTQALAGNTGEKPQSKVWKHANQWWSVFADSAGTGVWRLDGAAWTKVLNLATSSYRADIRPLGNLAHVLLEKDSHSLLATVEYVDGAPGTYQLWTARPQLIPVPLVSSTETATLDVDTTGRLWVAFDTSTQIQVIHSDAPYTSWSAPVVVADGVSTDDISAITALPNGKIGVLWSDQTTDRFGFRFHDDVSPPDQWSFDEVPAAQSALAVGGGMADDHLNIAVTSDGTLLAAVKTSYNNTSFPQIGLLVRRPSGVWDDLYEVDTIGTRAIVDVSEVQNRLLVIYRADNDKGPIVYKESLLSTIAFGSRVMLLDDIALSNPSSLKQPFENDLVVIASKTGALVGAHLTYAPRVNQAPVVAAGADQTVLLAGGATLDATVSDDGLPDPPGALTTTWSKVSGPGTVTFANAAAIDTTATFSTAGSYVLRLSANDGALVTWDDVVIDVSDEQPITQTLQDGLSSYAGTTDARLRSAYPDTNFGSATTLGVDATPAASALLRWDLSSIPAGSVIVEAKLTLTISDASVHGFEIYQVKRPWAENEATWNIASAGMPWGQAGASDPSDRGSTVLAILAASMTGASTIDLNAEGRAVLQSWVNNPSLNHGFIIQNYTTATDLLAFRSSEAGQTVRPALTISYLPPSPPAPQDQPPVVDAGADQTVVLSNGATLDATATDDGLPNPPGVLTTTWTKASGPGTVTFANAAAIDTTASFSQTGNYVLRLSANDGATVVSDDVVINVTEQTPVTQTFQNGVSSYSGTTDTRLRSSEPDRNVGENTTLYLDATPPSGVLLRWDVSAIPAGSAVVGATISLTITSDVSVDAFEIYEVKRPWLESEATWNSASAGLPWEQPGASGPTDRGSTVLGLVTGPAAGTTTVELNADGRAVLQSWVDNPSLNHGFTIQNYTTAGDLLGFRSSESAAAPILAISYLPPGGGSVAATTAAVTSKTAAGFKTISVKPSTAALSGLNGELARATAPNATRASPLVSAATEPSAGDATETPQAATAPAGTQFSAMSRNWVALRIARATLIDQVLADETFWSAIAARRRSR